MKNVLSKKNCTTLLVNNSEWIPNNRDGHKWLMRIPATDGFSITVVAKSSVPLVGRYPKYPAHTLLSWIIFKVHLVY